MASFNLTHLYPTLTPSRRPDFCERQLGTLQRTNTESSEQIFSEKELRVHKSQFPHSCVFERLIYFHDRSAYSAAGNMWTDHKNIKIAHKHMTMEIGTVAVQFPEKEYINGIFFAVQGLHGQQ
jgi:hypothetical protein